MLGIVHRNTMNVCRFFVECWFGSVLTVHEFDSYFRVSYYFTHFGYTVKQPVASFLWLNFCLLRQHRMKQNAVIDSLLHMIQIDSGIFLFVSTTVCSLCLFCGELFLLFGYFENYVMCLVKRSSVFCLPNSLNKNA